MDLDKLRVFYEVAKLGRFTKAAIKLNLSQSAVSRIISNLEYQVKTPLFYRRAHHSVLTQKGEILFDHTKRILAEAEAAKTKLLEKEGNEPQGLLNLATTYGFASTVLFPYIAHFLKLYPKVNINLICDDENFDLKAQEADMVIHPYKSNASGLIQKHLTTLRLNLYASPSYLEQFGNPKTLEDLDNHRFIVFEKVPRRFPCSDTSWVLTEGKPQGTSRKPYMKVNSVECLVQAAENGLGITELSHISLIVKKALQKKKLVRVLPQIGKSFLDVHIIYPEKLSKFRPLLSFEKYLLDVFEEKELLEIYGQT